MNQATAQPAGFRHEAALYHDDEEFLDIVVPFLREGLAAGDAALLRVNARLRSMVRDVLGATDTLAALDPGDHDTHPLSTLEENRDVLARLFTAGAARLRFVGEVPHVGAEWAGWAGYEASVNRFYAQLPVWAVCAYDVRQAPPRVIEDVTRTHGLLADRAGGHRVSPAWTDPVDFLDEQARETTRALAGRRPDLHLTDPQLSDARLGVATLALGTGLDAGAVSGLSFAANEVLTNAVMHGRAPVTLRAWADPDGVVVAVHDRGRGPGHPYGGLLRDCDDPVLRGDGLWLARRMCTRVDLVTAPDGFTVYLTARVGRDGADRPTAV